MKRTFQAGDQPSLPVSQAVVSSHLNRKETRLNGCRFGFEENPERFFIDDVLLSAKDIGIFLTDFRREYVVIRDSEKKVLRGLRGDILDRLDKIAGDIDKIKYLIEHAFKEQTHRTNQALKKVLAGHAWIVSQRSPVVMQSAAAAVSVSRSLLVEPESEPVLTRKEYPFVDAVDYFLNRLDGTLLFDRVISDTSRFTTALRNYRSAPDDEKLQTVSMVLSFRERDAIACLEMVELIDDFSEPGDKVTMVEEQAVLARQHEIVAYYFLLQSMESSAPVFLAFEKKVQDARSLLSEALIVPENFLGRCAEIGTAFRCVYMVLGQDDPVAAQFHARILSTEKDVSEVTTLFDNCGILDVNIDAVQARFFYAKRFMTMIAGKAHALSASIDEAKTILDTALSSFDPTNTYFFSSEDTSRAAQEKRDALIKEVVSAYLFLRAVSETDLLVHYHHLLKKIYVLYLHRGIQSSTERGVVCNHLAVELFQRSGLFEDVDVMSVHSAHRTQSAGGPTLFVRRESGRDAFEADCRKRWMRLPLTALQEAGLIEPRTAEAVFSKVVESPRYGIDRHFLERAFYLIQLINAEKFADAVNEARAFYALFSETLVLHFNTPNPFYNFLHDAFSDMVEGIKSRIIDKTKTVLREHREGESLMNKADAVCKEWDTALSEIIPLLLGQYSGLVTKISRMRTPLIYGLVNTHALNTIAESALQGVPFLHHQLVKLDPDEYMNYYPCVWVSEDEERETLLMRLSEAERAALTGNVSYFELLQGLYRCILKINPISVLMLAGRRVGDSKVVDMDDVAKPLTKEDVALMNLGAVGASYAMGMLEEAFKLLWQYEPTKNAVTFDVDGDPIFKGATEARALIHHSETNFFKYEILIKFYDRLKMLRTHFSHAEVVRYKDYHVEITQDFIQLFRLIDAAREEIKQKGEAGKKFDKLLNETFKNAIGLTQERWITYCSQVTDDARLDQHQPRPCLR